MSKKKKRLPIQTLLLFIVLIWIFFFLNLFKSYIPYYYIEKDIRLEIVTDELETYRRENAVLYKQVVEAKSFRIIVEKAKQMGLVEIPVVVISGERVGK